ncbi:MAG: transcriptional regulator with XRE-family HTH domain [Phenylobacterium sp.]|jgi:transcriptional regulator with XRE-family HTH domain
MAKRVVSTEKPDCSLPVNMQRLGECVRFRRTSSGITIEDAASICGISKQTFCNVENGLETVRAETIFKVLACFGVKLRFDSQLNAELNAGDDDEWR